MIVSNFTKEALAVRRQRRDLEAKGYEEVGEGGGLLWELMRGYRYDHRIVDAIVSVTGKSVWVKVLPAGRTALAATKDGERA